MQSERKILFYLLNAYAFVARVRNIIIEREKNYSKYVLSEGAYYNKLLFTLRIFISSTFKVF